MIRLLSVGFAIAALIAAPQSLADTSIGIDHAMLNGSWSCERTLTLDDQEPVQAGGFKLFVDAEQWRTQTKNGEGRTDYLGKALYAHTKIMAEFSELKNFGDIDPKALKRQTEQPLPLTVKYELSDLSPDGFILHTEKTKLNCAPLNEEAK